MKSDTVTLREVTGDNLNEVLRLSVTEAQNAYVAPNAVSIAQAHYSDNAWYRAIYAGETPVGFVMVSVDTQKPEYMLWRYMIDHRHQGRGYGRQALRLVMDHIRTLPGADTFYLSCVPGDGGPEGFYRGMGFVPTGDWDDDEMIMVLALS